MNLHQTKALMDAKLTDKCFDAYIVLVGLDGKRTCLCSPNADLNTYFDAASMGKVLVTSTLILQACDKELLSLDDTLDKFFSNVPEEKKSITVKQLLTHTSGIVRKEFSREVADRGGDAIAAFILSVPLAFAPGSSYQYSCSGYVLLGLSALGILYFIVATIVHRKKAKKEAARMERRRSASPARSEAARMEERERRESASARRTSRFADENPGGYSRRASSRADTDEVYIPRRAAKKH